MEQEKFQNLGLNSEISAGSGLLAAVLTTWNKSLQNYDDTSLQLRFR